MRNTRYAPHHLHKVTSVGARNTGHNHGDAGCYSDDSDGSPQSGLLQLINGLNDTPALAFEVPDSNGDVIGVENFFGFQQASALLVLPEGNYEVEFSFDDPGKGFEESLLISEIAVRADTINFGLLEGEFATASLRW